MARPKKQVPLPAQVAPKDDKRAMRFYDRYLIQVNRGGPMRQIDSVTIMGKPIREEQVISQQTSERLNNTQDFQNPMSGNQILLQWNIPAGVASAGMVFPARKKVIVPEVRGAGNSIVQAEKAILEIDFPETDNIVEQPNTVTNA